MKTIFTSIAFLFFSLSVFSQSSEFKTHSNGLIYDTNTVNKLKHIVDSLNLKFKACETTETYYAKPQSKVLVLKIESNGIKKDLKNGISLAEFKSKYPKVKISTPTLVVVDQHKYYNEDRTQFSTMSLSEDYGTNITFNSHFKINEKYSKGSWIYKSKWETVFYLLEDFKKAELKDTYAHMIQYADCMVDTTSTKIFKNAEYGQPEMPKNYRRLTKKRQEKLLEKLRNTKVMGMCSQDDSPRVHAVNIAKLSAETVNWEVFLKAHLDIMNDRFERASDGSYAYAARKTYLKELEVLDIDITSLLFGISLRIDNANKNHYYGRINRLGRAIADAENKPELEKELTRVIADNELDDYNRYLIYYLYENYLYYSNEDKEDTSEIKEKLNNIKKSLPHYLVSND
jgi:hypothetical protein